jgi:DNA-binding beta-propeller fold protein YncE
MLTEQLPRPIKKFAEINFILMRGTYRPYFFFLILLLSSLFALFIPPASAIKLITVNLIFEISGQLNKPSDVSVSQSGLIYVVDGVNNKIKIFDRNGRFVSSFGNKGSGRGEFSQPLGIDIDDSDKIYIADSGNQRVQIFATTGNFITEIKLPPRDDHGADPTDVVVDNVNKKCYISDNDNHRVLAYDLAKLTLIETYGRHGSGRDRFRYPFLMALGKEQNLYVVDVINTRVQVLNSRGSFVAEIGGWGVEKGEFFRPKGVAVDKNNRVYVGDSYTGVIQVFEASGEFYGALGNPTTGKVQKFRTPMGLYVDHNNRLYVVETLANKVGVYQLEGVTE